MDEISAQRTDVRQRAVLALRQALKVASPGINLDAKGYTTSHADNLVPAVTPTDFEADLGQGSGDELAGKFRAAHSSSALAVNCFAPFKRHLSDLQVCDDRDFASLHFEKKCPTGLGGTPPNLDVLIEKADHVVGIESKCTEYLSRHTARFSTSYETGIRDARRESGWFQEMLRLIKSPQAYTWLDAAQLVKHAFGLMRCFPDRRVTLLYLYWEPRNADDHPVFQEHRLEAAAFAARIAGPHMAFWAMPYDDLWSSWDGAEQVWLRTHLRDLRARYVAAA